MKSLIDLGDQRRAVLEILWRRGPSTVRWIREELEPGLAYTSVLSVLQKLEALGWVGHERRGRTHLYAPKLSRAAARRHALDVFRHRVYGDDAHALALDASRFPSPTLSLKARVQRRRAFAA